MVVFYQPQLLYAPCVQSLHMPGANPTMAEYTIPLSLLSVDDSEIMEGL